VFRVDGSGRTVVARPGSEGSGCQGDELEAAVLDAAHDRGQGGEGGGAVAAAVVEDHDRAGPPARRYSGSTLIGSNIDGSPHRASRKRSTGCNSTPFGATPR